jgi:flagellar operon protein
MSNMVNGIRVPFVPIVTPEENNIVKPQKQGEIGSFDSIFDNELSKIKFSGHAAKRLESRNIQLSDTEMTKLQEAVGKAEAKGAKDSLIMLNDKAFIINIPNKTVVTAVEVAEGNENVFTNIDSVVFAL